MIAEGWREVTMSVIRMQSNRQTKAAAERRRDGPRGRAQGPVATQVKIAIGAACSLIAACSST
jgi:hypothetical protein